MVLPPIAELVMQLKNGEMTLEEVVEKVPSLDWGVRHEEVDGEIWWDGENTVGDVDILWYENVITDEERKAILNAVP